MPDVNVSIKSEIACLLFRCYGHGLYNGLFMDRKLSFDRSNLGETKTRIQYLLHYFVTWYNCRNPRKLDSDPNVSKIWGKP